MSDGNKYILLTVFNHLDSFRDALHFIVLQISQILVSMEGAAKKGGGKLKLRNIALINLEPLLMMVK